MEYKDVGRTMSKKVKHMDFEISSNEHIRLLFRFYPRKSSIHSFTEEPPKDFNDVYKVYYSWAIMESRNRAWHDEEPRWPEYKKIFSMRWDECSPLEHLVETIKTVVLTKEKQTGVVSMGQPSSEWIIGYHEMQGVFNEDIEDYLSFYVFNNWSNMGYRFSLDLSKVRKFIDYINSINSYMLKHGDPI